MILPSGQTAGYMRSSSENALTSQVTDSAINSYTPNALYVLNDQYDEWFDGVVWNVKCWDRALSAAELLIESYYLAVMFPSSLNFHWHLDRHDQTFDIGGNARAPTVNGSLATQDSGGSGVWQPRRRVFFVGQPNTARYIRTNGGLLLGANAGRIIAPVAP